MTCAELIATADRLRPNRYGTEDKLSWLSDIDWEIYKYVLALHEDCPEEPFISHESADEELLLSEGEGREIYLFYLLSEIDFHNAEIDKYNQSAARYNAAYKAWNDAYNRTHLPLGKGRLRF